MRTIRNSILPDRPSGRKEPALSMPENPESPRYTGNIPPDQPFTGEPVITSAELFAGRSALVIRHNGRDYRLRCTRLGKLILTA